MLVPVSRSTLATLCKIVLSLYWLALFAATHIPPTWRMIPREVNDKLEHFSGFMLLAFLVAVTWQLSAGILTSRHLWIVWFVLLAYVALDEITQIPVHRDCDYRDWIVDATGAAAGILLFVVLRRFVDTRINYATVKDAPTTKIEQR